LTAVSIACGIESLMLHLINFPFSGPVDASNCLARLSEQDRLLFIGNGVFSVVKASPAAHELQSAMQRIRIFALMPDLEVRGISIDTLLPDVRTVDYLGFVELAAEHGPVQSWFR
jgi:tRNA 2-thiouridine synthesizing protein B